MAINELTLKQMKNRNYQSSIFTRVIQSDKNEAKKMIADALAYFTELQQQGLAHEISEFNFRLALDEAIENAISHGNSCNPEKKIIITINGYIDRVDMTIEDEGSGFKPEPQLQKSATDDFFSPHGRGLCLLNKIGTIRWNKKGNSINVVLVE